MSKLATWKQHERRVSKLLDGQRLGATGVSNPDVVTDKLAVECKHRASLPIWLATALTKVRKHAGSQRTGIVVVHELGKHDSLVLLSLKDFAQLTHLVPEMLIDTEPVNGEPHA